MRWYIVHAYSNFERKVAESIKERATAAGLADQIDEVLVPMEEVVEMRRGRKVASERKFFPGRSEERRVGKEFISRWSAYH